MSSSITARRGVLAAAAAVLSALLAGCGADLTAPASNGTATTSAAPATASTSGTGDSSSASSSPASSSPASVTTAPTSSAPAVSRSVTPAPESTSAPATSVAGAPASSSVADTAAPGRALEAQLEAARSQAAASSAAVESSLAASRAADAAAGRSSVLQESLPTRVRVASIGVDSELIPLGLQEDGEVDVPSTAPGSPAGWYQNSPTPGERGPAVLLGHVGDTDGGKGVFADLADLEVGDLVEVDRADGSTAVFRVDRAESFEKGEFPVDQVYGNTDDAELRLITCDAYNDWTGRWESNVVAFATLVG